MREGIAGGPISGCRPRSEGSRSLPSKDDEGAQSRG